MLAFCFGAKKDVSMLFDLALSVLQNNLTISGADWELDIYGNPHLYLPPGNDCASLSVR